jgi:DNA-binding HxlR family transcriptional regulator
MTQKQKILRHMREHGQITTLIASHQYLCFRLSERIRELERDGHLIHRESVQQNGKRYIAYSLIEERQAAA